MAIVKAGNPLTTKFVQPGGSYTNDGYGMMTARATYYVDKDAGGTAVATGQVHPVYSDFFVHKFSLAKGALEIDTIEAEYVGIQTEIGNITRPNVTASHGLTSEHITTHPNFFGPTAPFTKAIAGNGTTFTDTSIPGEKVGGEFGATFKGTNTNAGGFIGFKDSTTEAKQYYYGKTHYLSPITSFSGVVYTKDLALVVKVRDAVGKTSNTNSFDGVKLLPDHMGTTWTTTVKGTSRHTILLSQVSFEDYCVPLGAAPKIVKINYEIRYNREGYPGEVYAPSTAATP
jgi:hypothetical protein